MRKICLILLIRLLSLSGFSQGLTFSTVGDVYNFEIGDTFEYSQSAANFLGFVGCNMSGYEMDVVLDKWNSTDTLYYKMQFSYSFFVHCSSSPHGSSNSSLDTIVRSYSNLDSSIFYNHEPSFCDTLNYCHDDSSYIDSSFCNRKTNRHFEGSYGWAYSYYDLVDGLGMIRRVVFNEDQGYEQSVSSMIYSSKINGLICGTFSPFVIVNGVWNTHNDVMTANLFPNPCSTSFTLQLSSPQTTETYFQLYDNLGSLVKREEITSTSTNINRNNLPSGIYFWQLHSDNKILGRGKLVTE